MKTFSPIPSWQEDSFDEIGNISMNNDSLVQTLSELPLNESGRIFRSPKNNISKQTGWQSPTVYEKNSEIRSNDYFIEDESIDEISPSENLPSISNQSQSPILWKRKPIAKLESPTTQNAGTRLRGPLTNSTNSNNSTNTFSRISTPQHGHRQIGTPLNHKSGKNHKVLIPLGKGNELNSLESNAQKTQNAQQMNQEFRSFTPDIRQSSNKDLLKIGIKRSETPNILAKKDSEKDVKDFRKAFKTKLQPLDLHGSQYDGDSPGSEQNSFSELPSDFLHNESKVGSKSLLTPLKVKREDSLSYIDSLKKNALEQAEDFESTKNKIQLLEDNSSHLPSISIKNNKNINHLEKETFEHSFTLSKRSSQQLASLTLNLSPSSKKQSHSTKESASNKEIKDKPISQDHESQKSQIVYPRAQSSLSSIYNEPENVNSTPMASVRSLPKTSQSSRPSTSLMSGQVQNQGSSLSIPTTLYQPSSDYLLPESYANIRTHEFKHFIYQLGERFSPFHSLLKISLFFVLKDILQFHEVYLESKDQIDEIQNFLNSYDPQFQVYASNLYDDSAALYSILCNITTFLPFPFLVKILESKWKLSNDKDASMRNIDQDRLIQQGEESTSNEFVNEINTFSSFIDFDPSKKDLIVFSALCAHSYIEPNIIIQNKYAMKFLYDCLQYDDLVPSTQPSTSTENTENTQDTVKNSISLYNLYFIFASFHMLILSMPETNDGIYHKDVEYVLFPKCIRLLVSVCRQLHDEQIPFQFYLMKPILSILDTLFEKNDIFLKIYMKMDIQGQYFIDLLNYTNIREDSYNILCIQKLSFRLLHKIFQSHHANREFKFYSNILLSLLPTTIRFLHSFSIANHEIHSKTIFESQSLLNSIWNTSDDFIPILLHFIQHVLSILYDINSKDLFFKGTSQGFTLKQDIQKSIDPVMLIHSLFLIAYASRGALLSFQYDQKNNKDKDEQSSSTKLSEDILSPILTLNPQEAEEDEDNFSDISEEYPRSPRDEISMNTRVSHAKNILFNVFLCLDYIAMQKVFSNMLLQLGLIRLAKKSLQKMGYSHVIIQLLQTLSQQDSYTISKLTFEEPSFFKVLIDVAFDCFDSHAGSLSLLKVIDGILKGFVSHKENENIVSKFRIHEYRILRTQIIDKIRMFFVHHNPETRILTYEILHRVGCFELEMTRTIHRHLQRSDNAICKFFARSVSPNHIILSNAILSFLSDPSIDITKWGKFDHPTFNLNKDLVVQFPVCDVCGLVHSKERPLRMCSGCKARLYCSKKCQDYHYRYHRKYCNPSRKLDYEQWVVVVNE